MTARHELLAAADRVAQQARFDEDTVAGYTDSPPRRMVWVLAPETMYWLRRLLYAEDVVVSDMVLEPRLLGIPLVVGEAVEAGRLELRVLAGHVDVPEPGS